MTMTNYRLAVLIELADARKLATSEGNSESIFGRLGFYNLSRFGYGY